MTDLYDALVAQPLPRPALAGLLTAGYARLKPGAHAVVKAAPDALWDTARALEDAGFDIRDVVANVRDRSAERDAFLAGLSAEQRAAFGRLWPSLLSNRPAVELWWLARKPFEGTVAEQVLAVGTGAINIDGCRIAGAPPSVPQPMFNSPTGRVYGMKTGEGRNGVMSAATGRWPANLVLQHGPGCKRAGTKQIRGLTGGGMNLDGQGANTVYSRHQGHKKVKTIGYADEDGLETIEAWECSEGCPVRALDGQSGERPTSGGSPVIRRKSYSGYHGGDGVTGAQEVAYGDSGGASRFFNMFTSNDELLEHFLRLIVPPGGRVLDLVEVNGG